MKKWIVVACALFLLTNTAYGRQATNKNIRAQEQTSQSKAQSQDVCRSFAIMEMSTSKVLESKHIHDKIPPASITKLMVAYIVMEKITRGEIKLTDKVTASKNAEKMGGTQVYLYEGEVFLLEDLMKAMMIASANDAAYAIGEFISGSKDKFIKMMNEKAKELHLRDTEFHSLHGLPPSKNDLEDLTSCSDLLILSRELLKYPKILEWTSKKTDSLRNGSFVLENTNKLLYRMPEIDGLKTGYYRRAGFNIVTTAKKGDLRLIAVAMGCQTSKSRDRFVVDKLKRYFTQYKMLHAVKKGEVINKDIILEDGKFRKIKGIADATIIYPVPQNKKGDFKREIVLPESIKGEIKEGQKLGEIVIYLDNERIGKADIVSPVYVPKANLFTRLVRMLGLNI